MSFEMVVFSSIVFVYGILIGSFLNVCIYRIPKSESIITTRSHCMDCSYHLKWYDLIPVFSYLALRGRCRSCGTKLSIQYPLIEGLNGVLYVIIYLANGYHMTSVLFCLLTSALIVLSVIDWRTYEIPVGINWFIFALGCIRIVMDYEHWSYYLIGFVSVSAFLLLLFAITKGRGIGGGDIKLMAAAGLLVGWQEIVFALFAGCIIGSVCHLAIMKIKGEGHMLAFGPYLSVGIFLSVLFAQPFFDWYISIIL